jgi:siroheme synthase
MGKVYIIGTGPGDADLLTVRAVRALQAADVVLHDAPVSKEVLDLANPGARLINLGKRCGRRSFTQEEILFLLAYTAALAGTVVRLNAGDPLIFGRTGEELDVLRAAGIDFEVVPGVTRRRRAEKFADRPPLRLAGAVHDGSSRP